MSCAGLVMRSESALPTEPRVENQLSKQGQGSCKQDRKRRGRRKPVQQQHKSSARLRSSSGRRSSGSESC